MFPGIPKFKISYCPADCSVVSVTTGRADVTRAGPVLYRLTRR